MAEVKLMIDGRQIVADASKTVLEAALDNGIYIPHLCYHEISIRTAAAAFAL